MTAWLVLPRKTSTSKNRSQSGARKNVLMPTELRKCARCSKGLARVFQYPPRHYHPPVQPILRLALICLPWITVHFHRDSSSRGRGCMLMALAFIRYIGIPDSSRRRRLAVCRGNSISKVLLLNPGLENYLHPGQRLIEVNVLRVPDILSA